MAALPSKNASNSKNRSYSDSFPLYLTNEITSIPMDFTVWCIEKQPRKNTSPNIYINYRQQAQDTVKSKGG